MWISVQLRASVRLIALWNQSEQWRFVSALREGRAVEIAIAISEGVWALSDFHGASEKNKCR